MQYKQIPDFPHNALSVRAALHDGAIQHANEFPAYQAMHREAYLEKVERDAWILYGMRRPALRNAAISRAAFRWACITSKSHRQHETSGSKYPLVISSYENLTVVKPWIVDAACFRPPSRAGKSISEFSERSRYRLMDKSMKMRREGVPLPYFVTLTYRQNFTDTVAAKRHLDTFFKRWRRRAAATETQFRYVWKMEPQERGAIHFHIAFFIDAKLAALHIRKSNSPKERLRAFRELIGREWAEITKDVDFIDVPRTVFKWKKKRIDPDSRELVINRIPDPVHEKVGTNVREVYNWEMFTGYISKYIGKTVTGEKLFNGHSGRYWGFSRNFDFGWIIQRVTDRERLIDVHELCRELNDAEFYNRQQQLKAAKRRALEMPGKKSEIRLERISKSLEKAARRWAFNAEKIERGVMMRFQVLQDQAAVIIENTVVTRSNDEELKYLTNRDIYHIIEEFNNRNNT